VQSRSRARCSYLFLPGLVRGSLAVPGSGSRGLKTHLSRTCFRSMWRPLVASGETKTRRTIIDVTWLRENLRLVVRLPALASSAQHPKLPFERNCRLAPVPAYIYNHILPCTMLVGAQEEQYATLVNGAVSCLERVQEVCPVGSMHSSGGRREPQRQIRQPCRGPYHKPFIAKNYRSPDLRSLIRNLQASQRWGDISTPLMKEQRTPGGDSLKMPVLTFAIITRKNYPHYHFILRLHNDE
jgi:hypothetical protein